MNRYLSSLACLALLAVAGCRDSYPNPIPPTNVLYYPVGIAVRQGPPDVPGGKPYGSTQLVIVNSNFDLRYDEFTGGTVLVVDPDQSTDTVDPNNPAALAVLGAARVGSFGGEVAVVEAACQDGWPDCPSACSSVVTGDNPDPAVAAGGAQVVLAARSVQTIYKMSMSRDGNLQCGDGCTYSLPIDRLSPYGVSVACSDVTGSPLAYAFVSHLQAANNLGWLSRLDLHPGGSVLGLVLGNNPTYTSLYDRVHQRQFVTSTTSLGGVFRWFNPLVDVSTGAGGYAIPDFKAPFFGNLVIGGVARDMALSADGNTLYVTVLLYDYTIALQTGVIYVLGGALATFDLTPNAYAEPSMALIAVERSCQGAGQIRRLPRSGTMPGAKSDLFAISCDGEGSLAIYDSDARRVVRYIGLDAKTGLPALGLLPFGIAVEPVKPQRAIVPVQNPLYPSLYPTTSPCAGAATCDRIYVGSFYDDWVNIIELDPDNAGSAALVKRIGRGP